MSELAPIGIFAFLVRLCLIYVGSRTAEAVLTDVWVAN